MWHRHSGLGEKQHGPFYASCDTWPSLSFLQHPNDKARRTPFPHPHITLIKFEYDTITERTGVMGDKMVSIALHYVLMFDFPPQHTSQIVDCLLEKWGCDVNLSVMGFTMRMALLFSTNIKIHSACYNNPSLPHANPSPLSFNTRIPFPSFHPI